MKGSYVQIGRMERILVLLTAAFVLFAFGYFLGRNTALSEVTVHSTAELLAPDTNGTDEVQASLPAEQTSRAEESEPVADQRVNINTADAALLDTLPGIGPVLAERIIEDRETNGPFQTAEDITRVSGIGEKMLEKLYDLITVG